MKGVKKKVLNIYEISDQHNTFRVASRTRTQAQNFLIGDGHIVSLTEINDVKIVGSIPWGSVKLNPCFYPEVQT